MVGDSIIGGWARNILEIEIWKRSISCGDACIRLGPAQVQNEDRLLLWGFVCVEIVDEIPLRVTDRSVLSVFCGIRTVPKPSTAKLGAVFF